MKTKEKVSQKKFENDYNKIMKEFNCGNAPFNHNHQWTNPRDFIVKFTLFQDAPGSITSSDTSVNL